MLTWSLYSLTDLKLLLICRPILAFVLLCFNEDSQGYITNQTACRMCKVDDWNLWKSDRIVPTSLRFGYFIGDEVWDIQIINTPAWLTSPSVTAWNNKKLYNQLNLSYSNSHLKQYVKHCTDMKFTRSSWFNRPNLPITMSCRLKHPLISVVCLFSPNQRSSRSLLSIRLISPTALCRLLWAV